MTFNLGRQEFEDDSIRELRVASLGRDSVSIVVGVKDNAGSGQASIATHGKTVKERFVPRTGFRSEQESGSAVDVRSVGRV